jgi:hypothetical protein
MQRCTHGTTVDRLRLTNLSLSNVLRAMINITYTYRFYLVDGGNNTEFAAAVRLRSGTGASLREWPIKEGCCFSVGNSVFHCSRQQPPTESTADSATTAGTTSGTATGTSASDKPAQDAAARYVLLLHIPFQLYWPVLKVPRVCTLYVINVACYSDQSGSAPSHVVCTYTSCYSLNAHI